MNMERDGHVFEYMGWIDTVYFQWLSGQGSQAMAIVPLVCDKLVIVVQVSLTPLYQIGFARGKPCCLVPFVQNIY